MLIGVGRSADDAFILITVGNQETSEARVVPAATPTATPVVLEPRQVGRLYEADHWGDRWVIRTNADDAIDFRIVEAPTATPGKAHWTDLVPHTPGRYIEGVALVKDYLGRQERAEANTRIVIRDRSGGEHEIAVDEPAYALSLGGASEFDTTVMRYGYNSPSTPTSTYDYDLATRERTLRKVQEVPSGHDAADYVVERLNAPAPDGELVPVTVLRRRDTPVDGSAAPALWLWLIRDPHGRQLLDQPAVAGRPRLDLRHRSHPRRVGQGLGLVPRRPALHQEEHLHRLHRRCRAPDLERPRQGRSYRRPGRVGGGC